MTGTVKLWRFEGIVLHFNRVIENHITMETYAVTEKQAKRNLTGRYKRDHGHAMNARIELQGKFTCEDI